VHANKIAKMIVGVENMVVQDVGFDGDGRCVVISARPTAWHACECGRCGRKAPAYDAGQGRRRWHCTDVGQFKCYVDADAFRVDCPVCGPTVRGFPWAAHGSRFTYSFEETCAGAR
jgi:transposase